VTGKLTDCKYN